VSGQGQIDVLVLGELNPDLVLSGEDLTPAFGQVETLVEHSTLTMGSSGAIFGAGTAKLGLRTVISGLVGADTFGSFVLDRLRELGVGAEGVIVDPDVTTGLTVILNRGEDRAILTHLGAMAEMAVSRIDRRLLDRSRHVHITSYFLQHALQSGLPDIVRHARSRGTTVSMDTNWDPAERWDDGVHEVLRSVDTFLPNEAEAMALTGSGTVEDAARALSEVVPEVVVKRGARGAYAICDGQVLEAPAVPVEVRDTTGAGDSFDAGYVYGQLRGLSPRERLRTACLCGALSTRGIGGVAAQATEADVQSIEEPS
jgi:sugar/nucleoside kinase (ribokinase family)